jgi:hypothetical protein
MKIKLLVISIATIFSLGVGVSFFSAPFFDKKGNGDSRIIIKSDKNSGSTVAFQHFFRSPFAPRGKPAAVFSSVSEPILIQECREQPVLAVCLLMFSAVSICGIGFVVYLIQTDVGFD